MHEAKGLIVKYTEKPMAKRDIIPAAGGLI